MSDHLHARRDGGLGTACARILSAAIILFCPLAWGGCAPSRAPAKIEAVFLIVVETLRPDGLSCYGDLGNDTPNIDALARSGIRFEHAEAAGSWTLPSMGALLTSRYPTQLGLVERPPAEPRHWAARERRPQFRIEIPNGVPTLAQLMDDAGYHPAAFVNQPLINRERAYLAGFAEWCYTTGERSLAWHDPTLAIPHIDWPRDTDLGRADTLLIDAFDRWLEYRADLKPFVWLHLMKPHWPYTPALRYLPKGVHPGAPVTPQVLYLAEIREVDDMIARVLASIDAHVGLDRSLVIFTSDHGEEFGEHGMIEHGHSLHREVVRVPLIIVGPTVPKGLVVESRVRLIDLLPTLLDLVGAGTLVPEHAEGRSLLPFEPQAADAMVYQEGMLYGSTERSLTEQHYKLMYDAQASPPYRLFDIEADPWETSDVSARAPERLAQLQSQLQTLHTRLVGDFESLVGPEGLKSDPETDRVLRAMRALGYVSN